VFISNNTCSKIAYVFLSFYIINGIVAQSVEILQFWFSWVPPCCGTLLYWREKKSQALVSFKNYMPYLKVNICPFPLSHFASIFFVYLWSFRWPNYIATLEIFLFSTATFKYTYRATLRRIGQEYSGNVACFIFKSQISETYWGEVGKRKRADVYLEVRKRRGHISFEWNKCLWKKCSIQHHTVCLGFFVPTGRGPNIAKLHVTREHTGIFQPILEILRK